MISGVYSMVVLLIMYAIVIFEKNFTRQDTIIMVVLLFPILYNVSFNLIGEM